MGSFGNIPIKVGKQKGNIAWRYTYFGHEFAYDGNVNLAITIGEKNAVIDIEGLVTEAENPSGRPALVIDELEFFVILGPVGTPEDKIGPLIGKALKKHFT